ncbi:hypothetical protein RDV89_13740 [Nocardioides zeae]|uniref:Uncharacterized protein n=1 Tax=Nocardioides imazamoxiresistens TaxID=3231893 RepID=A0ABU3PY36_9ACTN|nr:hypothetical protein [Nocardioides zeae]MDT9594140.1 hypothetical protein [Nocardioides zeae]
MGEVMGEVVRLRPRRTLVRADPTGRGSESPGEALVHDHLRCGWCAPTRLAAPEVAGVPRLSVVADRAGHDARQATAVEPT